MVGKISSKSKILFVEGIFFAIAAVGSLSVTAPFAYAAVGDCTDASLSFSKSSYVAGEQVQLNGSNSSGTWTLCIYEGNERVAVTVDSTDSDLSVNLGAEYAGEELTGVIHPNGICSNDLSTEGNCRIIANDNGVNEEEETATEEGENDAQDGVINNVGGGSLYGEGGSSGGSGNVTRAAGGSNAAVTTTIENPLETDDFTELVTNFLQWLLGIAGSLALLMLIYGGIIYISSAGDPQKAESGKKIVMWTIFGLIIILVSYSLIQTVKDIFVS